MIYFSFPKDSGTDDQGNFQENFIKQLQNYLAPLIFVALLLSSFSAGSSEQKEVGSVLITIAFAPILKRVNIIFFSYHADLMLKLYVY